MVGHLVQRGLHARLVLLAAWRAGAPRRAYDLFAHLDRQRAASSGEAGEILRAHLRVFLQPLFHFARGDTKGARRAFLKLFSIVCGPVPSPRICTRTSPLRPTTVADTR